MSWKVKAIAGAILVVIAGFIIVRRAREWPALPNSPVPLGELIEKSDLIVHARVAKVENTLAPLNAMTNRWVRKAIEFFGAQDRQFATAHLEIFETVKGRASDRVIVDYAIGLTTPPPPATDPNGRSVVVFVYRQRGAYHPVAYSYGTRILSRKETGDLLRWIAEFVATDKMGRRARERFRAEWFVRLIENPEMRWDGAASWLNGSAPTGEALKKLPADLAKRVEAVAFRDEPLAGGDELLLQEFAPSQRRKVVRRLLRYFQVATRRVIEEEDILEQPWRCHGAMQLLARVAGMPEGFKERLDKAPYPNLSAAKARAAFIDTYLPEIEKRLKEEGLVD